MTISEKERESSKIENEFMARKYARWANENLGKEFKARITATEVEVKAEIHDTISGARVLITSNGDIALFEDVIIRLETVDIARAKISAIVVGKVDS